MTKRKKGEHVRYQYLIWKSDEGFMYMDQFSSNELSTFLSDMGKAVDSAEDSDGQMKIIEGEKSE